MECDKVVSRTFPTGQKKLTEILCTKKGTHIASNNIIFTLSHLKSASFI